jgi:hypothetical protein
MTVIFVSYLLEKLCSEGVNLIQLAKNKIQWWAFVVTVIMRSLHKAHNWTQAKIQMSYLSASMFNFWVQWNLLLGCLHKDNVQWI